MNDNIRRSLEILKLSTDATIDEAKQAWRDLATIWHPDKHHGNERLRQMAEEELKRINAAWDELKEYFACQEKENIATEERRRREQSAWEEKQRKEKVEAEKVRRRQEEDEKKFVFLPCPYCGVTNRIPIEKPVNSATCGSCGKNMDKQCFTEENFRREHSYRDERDQYTNNSVKPKDDDSSIWKTKEGFRFLIMISIFAVLLIVSILQSKY